MAGNTWFSHDSLTLEQLTNVNLVSPASSDTSLGSDSTTMRWFEWVKTQLQVIQIDIMAANAYVFHEDTANIQDFRLRTRLVTKTEINRILDKMRINVTGTHSLFEHFNASTSTDGLQEYFRWYTFTLGGTLHTIDNLTRFQHDVRELFKKGRTG